MEAARQGIRREDHYPTKEPTEGRGTGRPFAPHLKLPVFLDCFSCDDFRAFQLNVSEQGLAKLCFV